MRPEVIAPLAAGIGALGAIGGQAVAAVAARKRERERLAWEREQVGRLVQTEAAKQFLDVKRLLYVEFLRAARDARGYLDTTALTRLRFRRR